MLNNTIPVMTYQRLETVQQASNNGTNNANDNENIDELFDYESLNEKQKIIFNRVESHYKNILTGIQVEALRIIVMGTAGTGKSYLIKAILVLLTVQFGPTLSQSQTKLIDLDLQVEPMGSLISVP